MNRTIQIVGIAALLVTGIEFAVGTIGRTQPAPQATQEMTATVKIDNFSFVPTTLQIKPGTKVTWTNADDIPHTVVSDDKIFKSKALDTDEKFSYTFDKPGTYPYFCSLHPKMTAKVIVQ